MYYVLTLNNEKLVGITTENPYSFNLPNVFISEMEGPVPDLNQYTWNFDTSEFERAGHIFTKRQFMSKFTFEERTAIRASSDPVVADIMNMLELAEYVSINDETTIQSVQYLAMTGLILPTRVPEILS